MLLFINFSLVNIYKKLNIYVEIIYKNYELNIYIKRAIFILILITFYKE